MRETLRELWPIPAFAIICIGLVACKPGAAITCPALKQYSQDFMAAAAREYAMIEKQAPHLVRLVDDYGIERDAIRACFRRKRGK